MSVRRVLVVDDNPADRAHVCRCLSEQLGACVFAEPSDPSALAAAMQADEPALVVTDYRLGWTDGFEVLGAVKACWPDCPVIMFTRTGDEGVAVQGMKLGLDDYVLKGAAHGPGLSAAAAVAVARGLLRRELGTTQEELRAAQKLEAFGLLASGMAHDFNNVISVVLGYSQLLLSGGRLSPRDHDVALQLNEAGKRAAGLTRQFLTFGRRPVVRARPAGLGALAANQVPMLRRLVGAGIEVVAEQAGGLPRALVDTGLVEQVLVILALNSRDAMAGGGTIRISVGQQTVDPSRAGPLGVAPGLFVSLSVSDTGVGMTPAVRDRLFEPFFTSKGAGMGTGLGLGLFAIRTIMKQHHGWIEVDSQEGTGTTFTAHFPTEGASPGLVATAREPEEQPSKPRGARILLAEDDAAVRDLVVQILRIQGFEVTVCESGVEAEARYREIGGQIDMLLTDLVMPGGVTGQELAIRLRADRPSLPVVFMSGYARNVVIGMGGTPREGRLIQKPFTMDELLGAIREALGPRAARAQGRPL